MAQPHTYKQGHSNYTLATHLRRTAQTDAAFLLPHIARDAAILDVGCGPGTITIGLALAAPKGITVGVDVSPSVLVKARALADEHNLSHEGPGSLAFEEANVLDSLPFPDGTFDVVYASQLFGHLPMPDHPVTALRECLRVLRPGGLLATRDGVGQHFFPSQPDLQRLWVQRFRRAMKQGDLEPVGPSMPNLLRKAGFNVDDPEKVQLSTTTQALWRAEEREWLAWRCKGQLQPGDAFRQSWVDAGITEEEIAETLEGVKTWAATEDAWFTAVQLQLLAWK